MTGATAAAMVAVAVLTWSVVPGSGRARASQRVAQRIGFAARIEAWEVRLMCGLGSCVVVLVILGAGDPRSWLLAVALGGATAFAAGIPASQTRQRTKEAMERSMPHMCELLAVCLEAGLPLRTAVAAVSRVLDGPLGDALVVARQQTEAGASDAQVWQDLSREPGCEPVARDVARLVDSGVGLADVLRRHATESRRDQSGRLAIRARRVSITSVGPLVLCSLPAFLLLGVVPIIGGVIGSLV